MKKRRINPEWAVEAEEAAIKRRDFHSKFGSKKHWHDPKKGEYADEIYGNLAQIAFREFVKTNYPNMKLDFAPLFTENLKELPEYDARLDKTTVEIKCIPPDDEKVKRKRLLIKQSECKNMDCYVAIKFWSKDEYSFCGYVKKKDLETAPVRNFGFVPAYYFFLDDLPHKLKLCPDG